MTKERTEVAVVLGAASFGRAPLGGIKTESDLKIIQSILDDFKSRGHKQLDTARVYCDGTSEEILADLNYAEQGLLVDTKILCFVPQSLSPQKVTASVDASLSALKTNKVNILYLHVPDRETPFEDTLAAVNEEHKKGHFEKFGISNYTAEEVEKIVEIAKTKGYVLPTVYQGSYNLFARKNEDELFPVLRKHGISFYAYSPLAGSLLTGNVPRAKSEASSNARFDSNTQVGALYANLYHKEEFFVGIDKINEEGKKHGIEIQEIALRWIVHHSQLKRKYNDAIITGGKVLANLQKSFDFMEKGPLPYSVVKVVEEVWASVKDYAPAYHL